jgi:hypothetical protein
MYAAAPHTVKGRQIDVKPQVRYQMGWAVILIPYQIGLAVILIPRQMGLAVLLVPYQMGLAVILIPKQMDAWHVATWDW